jgi:hypothetical protein
MMAGAGSRGRLHLLAAGRQKHKRRKAWAKRIPFNDTLSMTSFLPLGPTSKRFHHFLITP